MVVVLPQPLGPIMPRMAPRGRVMFRSKTPAPPPKSRQAFSMRRTGSDEDVLGLMLIGGPLLTLRHAPRSVLALRRAAKAMIGNKRRLSYWIPATPCPRCARGALGESTRE